MGSPRLRFWGFTVATVLVCAGEIGGATVNGVPVVLRRADGTEIGPAQGCSAWGQLPTGFELQGTQLTASFAAEAFSWGFGAVFLMFIIGFTARAAISAVRQIG